MFSYLVRRLLLSVITLLAITFIVYGLIRSMPGTPLTMDMATADPSKMLSPADIKRLERDFGLDKPWYEAYFYWLGEVVQGNLGRSFAQKVPVSRLIGERVGPTLLLSVSSLLLTYILAVPMGLYATMRSGKADERTLSTILYMLYSFPSFVAALLLQILFFQKLGWLPLYGLHSDGYESLSAFGKIKDVFEHALMPVICFTYGSLAYYSRFVYSNLQEVIRQDYVRTATAKGLGPKTVLIKHAFRNTLVPFVTLIGLTLPSLLSGAVIIERIFQWPGMGQLYFEALNARDYTIVMGLTLIFAILTLLGQLLADLLYAVVDPRVRVS